MSNKTKLVIKPMIVDYTGKLKAMEDKNIEHAQTFEFTIYKGNFLKDVFNVDDMFEAIQKASDIIKKEGMHISSCSMPSDFFYEVENKIETSM